ncbi:MAG TPA: hypothetical protein VG147_16575 [Solirubrobacteraceae bacterium]|jgi:hypothetical protein|nr:hypothetical protein [Solirubrobacteraceae bacterium]
MVEQRQTKASKLEDELSRHSVSPEWRRKPPALRLRADTPELRVEAATRISDALARLRDSEVDMLSLRPDGSEPTAIVMPVERYLALVGSEMFHSSNGKIATTDGDFRPGDDVMEAAHVEQVDPTEPWSPAGDLR